MRTQDALDPGAPPEVWDRQMAAHDAWAQALTVEEIRRLLSTNGGYPFSLRAANHVCRTLLRAIDEQRATKAIRRWWLLGRKEW